MSPSVCNDAVEIPLPPSHAPSPLPPQSLLLPLSDDEHNHPPPRSQGSKLKSQTDDPPAETRLILALSFPHSNLSLPPPLERPKHYPHYAFQSLPLEKLPNLSPLSLQKILAPPHSPLAIYPHNPHHSSPNQKSPFSISFLPLPSPPFPPVPPPHNHLPLALELCHTLESPPPHPNTDPHARDLHLTEVLPRMVILSELPHFRPLPQSTNPLFSMPPTPPAMARIPLDKRKGPALLPEKFAPASSPLWFFHAIPVPPLTFVPPPILPVLPTDVPVPYLAALLPPTPRCYRVSPPTPLPLPHSRSIPHHDPRPPSSHASLTAQEFLLNQNHSLHALDRLKSLLTASSQIPPPQLNGSDVALSSTTAYQRTWSIASAIFSDAAKLCFS